MKIQRKILVQLVFLLIVSASCSTLMLNMVADKSIADNVKYLKNEEENREIVFMPMVHLGSESYYSEIKEILDSLKKEGFVFYYESVGYKEELDSLERNLYDLKFRKLVGFHVPESYKDSTNKSLPKALTNSKFTNQDYKYLGVHSNGKVVDLSKKEIVMAYEEEKREVLLNECDYQTGLKEAYNCKDTVKYDEYFALHTLRNKHIVKTTLESDEKKIAMIYGKFHWYIIWSGLRDGGFELYRGRVRT